MSKEEITKKMLVQHEAYSRTEKPKPSDKLLFLQTHAANYKGLLASSSVENRAYIEQPSSDAKKVEGILRKTAHSPKDCGCSRKKNA